jgi:hypothetical protein
MPNGAASSPGILPFSVSATPLVSVHVIPSNLNPFTSAASGSKYNGSNGPEVNVTVIVAYADPVSANHANPVVINKTLRMLTPQFGPIGPSATYISWIAAAK